MKVKTNGIDSVMSAHLSRRPHPYHSRALVVDTQSRTTIELDYANLNQTIKVLLDIKNVMKQDLSDYLKANPGCDLENLALDAERQHVTSPDVTIVGRPKNQDESPADNEDTTQHGIDSVSEQDNSNHFAPIVEWQATSH